MYLSCYQAAQYLTERPDWDGKTLVVSGGSQGGQQSLMLAGIASEDFRCAGPGAGWVRLCSARCRSRCRGWPAWYWQTQGKDPEKVRRTARYLRYREFCDTDQLPCAGGHGFDRPSLSAGSDFCGREPNLSRRKKLLLCRNPNTRKRIIRSARIISVGACGRRNCGTICLCRSRLREHSRQVCRFRSAMRSWFRPHQESLRRIARIFAADARKLSETSCGNRSSFATRCA